MNYRIEKCGALYFHIGSPDHEEAIEREQTASDDLRRLHEENDALRLRLSAMTVALEQLRQERERDKARHDVAALEQREQWRALARTRRHA